MRRTSSRKKTQSNFDGAALPVGSCVESAGERFYIQDNTRLRIPSEAIFKSWAFPYVLLSGKGTLAKLPIVGILGFRAGTVIYSLEDGLYYLIEKHKKRQITDPRWFDWLGMDRLDAVVASKDDAQLHKTGEVL